MAESLINIFGGHHARHVGKNVTRQPLSNIENKGKMVSSGPIKPNEPMKKAGEPKSFLSNTGKALQSTPARKVFTPRAVNAASLIYSDDNDKELNMEEMEFTKPTYKYDNYKDLIDFLLPESGLQHLDVSPPPTPPPEIRRCSMELDSSYQSDFFTDYSLDSEDDDLGLPVLY